MKDAEIHRSSMGALLDQENVTLRGPGQREQDVDPLDASDTLPGQVAPGHILLVDDEANILTALKRVFRTLDCVVHTADSGRAGLQVLAHEKIDLVISDMRMPHMSGAEFLHQVRRHDPSIVRVLLTGHSDMDETIAAINRGEIFRYLSKPWDEREVLLVVKQALENRRLLDDKRRLEELVQAQNLQLREWNASLEKKVHARTGELHQTMQLLEAAHAELKKSFVTSIKVFSNLIDMREGSMAGHARRVADLSRSIAVQMGIPDSEVQDIFIAGLLHDIGKFGLPDSVLRKPYATLSFEERKEVNKHPIKGQAVLMDLDQLAEVGLIIRHHHERFDGQGYPDGLSGLSLPLGARILAVANDYDALLAGLMQLRKFTKEGALQEIQQNAGKRYDPTVVRILTRLLDGATESVECASGELEIGTDKLAVGMQLSRDLMTRDGVLLLSKERPLDNKIIAQIRHYEKIDGRALSAFITAR
ncbi:MAG: HD domain-containing phosphohydrolase [Rhodoferax sp.]